MHAYKCASPPHWAMQGYGALLKKNNIMQVYIYAYQPLYLILP